ncbi:MAG: transcription elongation factor GreA [Deltaproteobacteria bacterium]|nr:transcription elongation factor GreA [Deltaproteobacteria bacterium]
MRFPMTPRGHLALKRELRECKAERPKLAEIILVARELGDISENADYDAAKERQAFLEGRIIELESKIAQADVIDPGALSGDRVAFGATVELEEVDSGETKTYQIVGQDEADVKKGMISITSPVARGLLKHEVGDEVVVNVPGGQRTYEIVNVSFG